LQFAEGFSTAASTLYSENLYCEHIGRLNEKSVVEEQAFLEGHVTVTRSRIVIGNQTYPVA